MSGGAFIDRVVTAALRAPSAENCQPFRYRWDGDALEVLHDPERAEHTLDRDLGCSLLGLGCVLESVSLAAGAEGSRAECTVREGVSAGGVWATVRFTPDAGGVDRLAEWIPRRVTDRRCFDGGTIADLGELRGEGTERCAVSLHDGRDRALREHLFAADGFVWGNDAVLRDVLRWIRFSPGELRERGDGIPWEALGLGLPRVPGMGLSRTALARALGRRVGVEHLARMWLERQLDSSAGVVCIAARDPGDRVEAGRVLMRLWLRLNARGYAVQPMSPGAVTVWLGAKGSLPEGTTEAQRKAFTEGRAVMERCFGYGSDRLPIELLRTGRSPGALPPGARAPRRELSSVLTRG